MSRKVFGDLQSQPKPSTEGGEAVTVAPAVRPDRQRARPILGSPDLMMDASVRPVGAIGQSLFENSERARRADEIETQLKKGQTIVELDPKLIEPSFVSDRMPTSPEAVASLTEKIRDHGQLNPILVRPSPEGNGRYQVAFGHRRLRAITILGGTVKAVVRDLSDEELVVAQGQENLEREDLTFIEKALFARRLEERGFSRATMMAAMSIYKSDLSNMLSVATKVPDDISLAIGAAPGIGRRGWIELSGLFAAANAASIARRKTVAPGFAELDTDRRFKAVLEALKARPAAVRTVEAWASATGSPLAKVAHDDDRVMVTIDRRKAPLFADFVLERLRDLYSEFETASQKQS